MFESINDVVSIARELYDDTHYQITVTHAQSACSESSQEKGTCPDKVTLRISPKGRYLNMYGISQAVRRSRLFHALRRKDSTAESNLVSMGSGYYEVTVAVKPPQLTTWSHVYNFLKAQSRDEDGQVVFECTPRPNYADPDHGGIVMKIAFTDVTSLTAAKAMRLSLETKLVESGIEHSLKFIHLPCRAPYVRHSKLEIVLKLPLLVDGISLVRTSPACFKAAGVEAVNV